MPTLKDYVKSEFFELPSHHWTNLMLQQFIQESIKKDTDVFEAIKHIDFDDLHQHIAEFSSSQINSEVLSIQGLMLSKAKDEIQSIIDEIQGDCDDFESDAELSREFERTELKSMGRYGV